MGDAQDQVRLPKYGASTPSGRSISTVSSPGREEPSQEPPKRAKRSFLTQNACSRCRSKKSKCDGKRPSCARCLKHGNICEYDVAQEGLTRMQNLQQQLERSMSENSKMQRLFNVLRHGSDVEATTLLARLRIGATMDDLMNDVASSGVFTGSVQSGPATAQRGLQQPPPQPTDATRWAAGPIVDQADWAPWGGSESAGLVMADASFQEEALDQSTPVPGYYDTTAIPEPHSPYFYNMPGSSDPPLPQPNVLDDTMQWRESDEIQPPSNRQYTEAHTPFGSQIVEAGPSDAGQRSSRKGRESRTSGSQKRKG